MIIDKKFAYIKTRKLFESLISTIPKNLNPIVFIEDTREMWTCGTYFSIGYPNIEVSEIGGSVKVEIGNSYFLVSTAGDSLSVRKGEDNRIILSSNALNRVDTEAPLEWNSADRKLYHMLSGVSPGNYGQSTNLGNASIFTIPNIIVDSTGHITSAKNYNIQIRDYVEQLSPTAIAGERGILVSNNTNTTDTDTGPVRKANGLTFNDATKKLTIDGGLSANGQVNITGGDLVVTGGVIVGNLEGDISGEARPKIHLSKTPEYGGASTGLYGHVIVQDELPVTEPPPSSNNVNVGNIGIIAVAATPLMVWNAIQEANRYTDTHGIRVYATDNNNNKQDISTEFTFSGDFNVDNKNIYINWTEIG